VILVLVGFVEIMFIMMLDLYILKHSKK